MFTMNTHKLLEAIALYRHELEALQAKRVRHPLEQPLPENGRREAALNHCYQMLDQMDIFIAEKRLDKFFRWLGFIQGAMWALGLHTVAELKEHNKPA